MITVISYPNNEINFSQSTPDTNISAELVKYMFIDVSETTEDTYIEVTYNGVVTTLNIIDECKYQPVDIYFLNKHGAEQVLTFFKEKTEEFKVSREVFERAGLQASDGYHQYKNFNIQGRSGFKVHSGFVDESMNETFKELMFSEMVWSLENDTFTPLNIKSSNFEYKTRQRDRLINYEIDFELSYNEINNI